MNCNIQPLIVKFKLFFFKGIVIFLYFGTKGIAKFCRTWILCRLSGGKFFLSSFGKEGGEEWQEDMHSVPALVEPCGSGQEEWGGHTFRGPKQFCIRCLWASSNVLLATPPPLEQSCLSFCRRCFLVTGQGIPRELQSNTLCSSANFQPQSLEATCSLGL